MKREIGACLLGSLLVAGCSSPEPQPTHYTPTGYGRLPPANPAISSRSAIATAKPARASESSSVASNRPTWQPYKAAAAKAPPPAAKSAVITVSHEEAAPVAAAGPDLTPADSPAATDSAPLPQTVTAGHTMPTATASAAPELVHVGFARAEDFSWLHGQVQYVRSTRSWRLRYADLSQEDPYGGSVTLTPQLNIEGLQDGQYVLARGQLVNPQARGIAPAYRVDTLQLGPTRK